MASRSRRKRAVRGAVWTLLGTGSADVLRLLSNLILTRLLFPEAFGLMAIVNLVVHGLQMVSNVGIQPAIIRHEAGDRAEFLDTAWTLQIARGLVLAILGVAIAWPVSILYEQPQLASMLAVGALAPLIDGFASTKLARMTRAIDLRPTVIVQLAAKIASIAAMIAFAFWYRSVWALVIGSLTVALTRTVLSHVAISGRGDRFRLDRTFAGEILSFGKWILVGTFLTYLGRRVDVLLLGKLVSLEVLGVYSIGLTLSAVAQQILSRLSRMVLMPVLAESHREGLDRLRQDLQRAKKVAFPAAALALAAAAVVAPIFFQQLYDPRYWSAGWMAQLALMSLWFGFLQDTNGRALLALGDSRSFAISNGVRAVVAALGCWAGYHAAGVPGVLLGLSVAALCSHLCVIAALRGHDIRTGRIDLATTLAALPLAAACALLPYWIASRFGVDNIALVTVILGAVLLAPPLVWYSATHGRRLLYGG